MGKALVVDKPDPADLALVMTTYRAFTVDLAEGDAVAVDGVASVAIF